jgi:hypothetical protein
MQNLQKRVAMNAPKAGFLYLVPYFPKNLGEYLLKQETFHWISVIDL